jgi:hypothetical protein
MRNLLPANESGFDTEIMAHFRLAKHHGRIEVSRDHGGVSPERWDDPDMLEVGNR